jgi:hypothetical protein
VAGIASPVQAFTTLSFKWNTHEPARPGCSYLKTFGALLSA